MSTIRVYLNSCPLLSLPPLQFIYISMEEMQAAADFIRRRGRIAIAELARSSDAFLDLTAREVVPLHGSMAASEGGGASVEVQR